MTGLPRVGPQRSARTGRRALVTLGAALTLLPLGAGSASAQTFLDPANVCTVPAPPAGFTDRDQVAAVHLAAVDCAVAQEIAIGRPGNVYEPKSDMRRDQMASLIARTEEAGGFALPAPQDSAYSDVPNGSVHDDRISQLTQIGVIAGKGDGTYAPADPVRRDQMASFMVRAANFAYENDELRGNTSPDYVFPFIDVVPTNPHRDAIAAADDLIGVTQGRTDDMYDPELSVPRDQMATFVIRLLDVTAIPESTQ